MFTPLSEQQICTRADLQKPEQPLGLLDLLYNVIDGLADDFFHPLRVLFSHSLQSYTERRLLGAAIVSTQQEVLISSQQIHKWSNT